MEGIPAAGKPPVDVITDIESIARRLGCAEGEWTLKFRVADGHLVRTPELSHGPIKNDELEALARAVGVLRD